MNCKNCNGFINPGDVFCQTCGAKIDNNNINDYQNSSYNINLSHKKSWENYLKSYILAIIVGTILFCIYAFLITKFSSKGNGYFISVTIGFFIILFVICYCFMSRNGNADEGRYDTIFQTKVDNNTSNYMDQILKNLGYKIINYKGEQVYFSKNNGGYLIGSSAYPRYIKFQVIPNGIKIQAWVVFRRKEMGLKGDLGVAIKSKLKDDLDYIYNSIVIK